MRVKAAPDAAVTRLHASTRRPDIGGTVPYDSSLLRHCACCRNQHNGGNYKNILPHSLSSSFCTPDMHGLTRQPSRILSDYLLSNYFVPVVPVPVVPLPVVSLPPPRRVSRRS